MALVLGGIVFKNFEIPQDIVFPLRQRHHVHYLVGAERVIDAVGPDPQPIRWEGRFTGPDATPRVRSLQSMTSSGIEWLLVYASFLEQVLITEFTPILEKPYDIRYRIEVLPTTTRGSGGIPATASSFDTTSAVVSSDLKSATQTLATGGILL